MNYKEIDQKTEVQSEEFISMLSITQQVCGRVKPGSRVHAGLQFLGWPLLQYLLPTSLRDSIIYAL